MLLLLSSQGPVLEGNKCSGCTAFCLLAGVSFQRAVVCLHNPSKCCLLPSDRFRQKSKASFQISGISKAAWFIPHWHLCSDSCLVLRSPENTGRQVGNVCKTTEWELQLCLFYPSNLGDSSQFATGCHYQALCCELHPPCWNKSGNAISNKDFLLSLEDHCTNFLGIFQIFSRLPNLVFK